MSIFIQENLNTNTTFYFNLTIKLLGKFLKDDINFKSMYINYNEILLVKFLKIVDY